MVLGERIKQQLELVGLSQSELARRVGITQSTINNLIAGRSRSSTHLHKMARELSTTPAYLAGETDNPDPDAPPPPRLIAAPHLIMMPVALPSENALAQMFEGLLEVADRAAPTAALARELAQLLPSGLLQLRGRVSDLVQLAPPRRREVAEALANEDREPPR